MSKWEIMSWVGRPCYCSSGNQRKKRDFSLNRTVEKKDHDEDLRVVRFRSRATRIHFGGPDKDLKIGDACISVHSVTKVNDVPLPASCRNTAARGFSHLFRSSSSQEFFIHVSLKNQVRIIPAGGCQIMACAQTDDFRAGNGHQIQVGTVFDEENPRHAAGASKNCLVMRLGPTLIFVPIQQSGPGVEELIKIRPFPNEVV